MTVAFIHVHRRLRFRWRRLLNVPAHRCWAMRWKRWMNRNLNYFNSFVRIQNPSLDLTRLELWSAWKIVVKSMQTSHQSSPDAHTQLQHTHIQLWVICRRRHSQFISFICIFHSFGRWAGDKWLALFHQLNLNGHACPFQSISVSSHKNRMNLHILCLILSLSLGLFGANE